MTKIVINTCYGGYGLSLEAIYYLSLIGDPEAKIYLIEHQFSSYLYFLKNGEDEYNLMDTHYIHGYDRSNPFLIKAAENLGDQANSMYSELKIVEIPDDVSWNVADYDGVEWVEETHRTWR